jgi:hypothetical protein
VCESKSHSFSSPVVDSWDERSVHTLLAWDDICCFQDVIGVKDCRPFEDGDKRKVVEFVLFSRPGCALHPRWRFSGRKCSMTCLKNAQGCCIWPQAIDVLGDFVVVVVVCEGGS